MHGWMRHTRRTQRTRAHANRQVHTQQSMLVVPMDSKGIIVKRALSVFGYDDAPHGHAEARPPARPTNRPTAAMSF